MLTLLVEQLDELEQRLTAVDAKIRGWHRTNQVGSGLSGSLASFMGSQEADLPNRRETLELVRAFDRITDPAVPERMLELTKSLATADKA